MKTARRNKKKIVQQMEATAQLGNCGSGVTLKGIIDVSVNWLKLTLRSELHFPESCQRSYQRKP